MTFSFWEKTSDKELKVVTDRTITNYVLDSRYETIFGESSTLYCFKNVADVLVSFKCQENSNLVSIGQYSFYQCTALQTVDLSSCTRLKTINESAFYGCSSLSSINFPEGLEIIDQSSFQLTALTSITIPSSVLILGYAAFRECNRLKSVTFLPNSKLQIINNNCFLYCPLTTLTIPTEVSQFTGMIFNGNPKMESIVVEKENKNYVSDEMNRYVVNSDRTTFVYFASAIKGSFTVPEGITTIGACAFTSSCLDSIILPDSVTQLSVYVFIRSTVNSITMPDTVNNIGEASFMYTSKLKSINLPSHMKTLSKSLFMYSGIVNITIPENVTTIQDGAFSNCYSLQNVILSKNLQTIGGNVFPSKNNINFEFGGDSAIYIDSQYLLMDKSNTYISLYLGSGQNTIDIPSTVKTIKYSAFFGKLDITTVICSGESQLERIENYAFCNCKFLSSFFNFPNIKYIGINAFAFTRFSNALSFGSDFYKVEESAFLNCFLIPSISFSSSVPLEIGAKSFYQCSSVSTLIFKMTNTAKINDEAFYGLSKLQSVTFPNNIVSYGSYCFSVCGIEQISFDNNKISSSSFSTGMFKDCFNLRSLTIPSNVNIIGSLSLSNISVTNLDIPDSVREFGIQCFKSCVHLVSININSNSELNIINYGVFEGCSVFSKISSFKNAYFMTDYGALYDASRTRMIVYPPASPNRYFALAYTITSIADSAFIGCIYLESILIPDNTVTSIGRSAFSGCINLKSINIPLSVMEIGEDSFLGCKNLHCGSILFQNKTSSFRAQLLRAGVNSNVLSTCERQTCRSTYYSVQYFLCAVFIIL